jgi:hypothetical protein
VSVVSVTTHIGDENNGKEWMQIHIQIKKEWKQHDQTYFT